jgi:hypothetical protein
MQAAWSAAAAASADPPAAGSTNACTSQSPGAGTWGCTSSLGHTVGLGCAVAMMSSLCCWGVHHESHRTPPAGRTQCTPLVATGANSVLCACADVARSLATTQCLVLGPLNSTSACVAAAHLCRLSWGSGTA